MTSTEKSSYPLFQRLAEKQIGVRALSRLAGISTGTASRIFKGHDVNRPTAEAIARALDCHILDLFDFETFESGRFYPRQGEFVCPPYPAMNANKSDWEFWYLDHSQGQARRDEARKEWYGI